MSTHDLRALIDAQTKAYYIQGIPSLTQRLERLDTLFIDGIRYARKRLKKWMYPPYGKTFDSIIKIMLRF